MSKPVSALSGDGQEAAEAEASPSKLINSSPLRTWDGQSPLSNVPTTTSPITAVVSNEEWHYSPLTVVVIGASGDLAKKKVSGSGEERAAARNEATIGWLSVMGAIEANPEKSSS